MLRFDLERFVSRIGFKYFLFLVMLPVAAFTILETECNRSDYETEARRVLERVNGYESNRDWYESHLSLAVRWAVRMSEQQFDKTGQEYESMNETRFLPNLFRELIGKARDEGRTSIVDSLVAYREENCIGL